MKARPSGSFSKIQKQAFDNELERQIRAWKDNNLTDYELAVLWTLHDTFGFGKDRLKKFFDAYEKMPQKFLDEYDGIGTVDFIAHDKLKKIGVNIFEWRKEYEKKEN